MAFSVRMTAASMAVAAMLVACGGGDGADIPPPVKITSVKVMGDSLSDSGTFGFKFTVQGSAPTGKDATPIWVDRVAGNYVNSICARYSAGSAALTAYTENKDCTNYAVGGGRINPVGQTATPISILKQIQDASAAGFSGADLVVLDGGSNDAADVIGAFIRAASDGGATFNALIGTKLDGAAQTALMTQAKGDAKQFLVLAGGAYLQALAKEFAASIQQNVIGKGAQRVLLLNVPAITLTPRFQMVLDSIAKAFGGGDAGVAAAAQQEALFDSWVQVFNAQLANSVAAMPQVAVIDFYTEFKDQIRNPKQYDFTNVKTPVCPVTGVDSSGLPSYTFPSCTAQALSASIPQGETASTWWQRYVFADSFHPTPYGHQQLSQMATRVLVRMGWL